MRACARLAEKRTTKQYDLSLIGASCIPTAIPLRQAPKQPFSQKVQTCDTPPSEAGVRHIIKSGRIAGWPFARFEAAWAAGWVGRHRDNQSMAGVQPLWDVCGIGHRGPLVSDSGGGATTSLHDRYLSDETPFSFWTQRCATVVVWQ